MPETSELVPGEEQVVFFTLNLPGYTPAGSYPVTVRAEPVDAAIAPISAEVTVRVAPIEKLTLALSRQLSGFVIAGDKFTHTFAVTNLGNARVTAFVEAVSRPEWETTATPAELVLDSGQSAEVVVDINSPEDIAAVVNHSLTLKVRTSAGAEAEPAARASASARVIPQSRSAESVSMYPELTGSIGQRIAWDGRREIGPALRDAADVQQWRRLVWRRAARQPAVPG